VDKNSHLSNWSVVPWPAYLTTTSQDTSVDKVLYIVILIIIYQSNIVYVYLQCNVYFNVVYMFM